MIASHPSTAGVDRGATAAGAPLIPGAFSPRFARGFGWYVERLLSRRFRAVHIVRSTLDAAARLDEHPAPVIVLLNHPSWWDPLAAALLGRRFCPTRSVCAPMDAEQLRRFGFFRRVGLFGIDPDDGASLGPMIGYVDERFRVEERPTLFITPQGDFTDVRSPVRLRPGAAMIAARHPAARVVCAALEYCFWSDARPEVFVRLEACSVPGGTATSWLRAMTRAMQHNQDELAALVGARDPAPFARLLGAGEGRIHPVYDQWLRLKGRGGGIEPQRRGGRVDGPQGMPL